MPVYEFEGKRPRIGEGTFLHPEAVLIGDIEIGAGCYIAAGVVIRADDGPCVIGAGSNIQDNTVIHVQPGLSAKLGERCHIGHGAILHSPNLGYHVTIGLGSIVLDRCEIGDEALIGAGSLLTEGTIVPPRHLVLGSPGKVVKELSEQHLNINNIGTDFYQELAKRSIISMKRVD
ncbi:MAG: gamma carbonic anhydrase family protein [Candidatus Saccharibacteria bacterium]